MFWRVETLDIKLPNITPNHNSDHKKFNGPFSSNFTKNKKSRASVLYAANYWEGDK